MFVFINAYARIVVTELGIITELIPSKGLYQIVVTFTPLIDHGITTSLGQELLYEVIVPFENPKQLASIEGILISVVSP